MKPDTKVVFNITVANKLLIRGHKIVGIAPNNKMSGGAVFFFEYDQSIDHDIIEIIDQKHRQNKQK